MEEQFLDAVKKRDFDKVNALIKDGADVNFEHDTGMTALAGYFSESIADSAFKLTPHFAPSYPHHFGPK